MLLVDLHGTNDGSHVVVSSLKRKAGLLLRIAAVTTSRINLSPFPKDCRVVVALNATKTQFLGRFGANYEFLQS